MKAQTRKLVNLWKKSFKQDMTFVYVLLYDILFFAVFGGLAYLFFKLIEKRAASLRIVDLENYLAIATPAELQSLSVHLRSFVIFFCIGALILFLVWLFGYALSRSLIWNRLTGKKFYFHKYARFLVLCLLMFIVLFVCFIVYLPLLQIRPVVFTVLLYFIALLVFYVMFLIKMSYARTKRIFRSIALGFEKINWTVYFLLIPVFAVFAVISFIINVLLIGRILTNIIVTVLLLIIFWTWMRIFVAKTDAAIQTT